MSAFPAAQPWPTFAVTTSATSIASTTSSSPWSRAELAASWNSGTPGNPVSANSIEWARGDLNPHILSDTGT